MPFYLVYGKLVNVPTNLSEISEHPEYNLDDYSTIMKLKLRHAHDAARRQLIHQKTQRKVNYDENKRQITFKVGELVLIKDETSKKLDARYKGPFKVIDDLGENVAIKINRKSDIAHKDRIKRYKVEGRVVDKELDEEQDEEQNKEQDELKELTLIR